MKTDFTGFVLAGGRSSRMGADKLNLPIGGGSFLERAVKALTPVCVTVKIVLNESQQIAPGPPIVRDIYANRGALGGIHAALKNCATKYAVVLAVDLPFVSTGALEILIDFALASNKYVGFVPRQPDGQFQPLCAVYRARYCLPAAEQALSENESASVRDFLELIAPKFIESARLSENENLLFNVNFPADFEQVKNNRPL